MTPYMNRNAGVCHSLASKNEIRNIFNASPWFQIQLRWYNSFKTKRKLCNHSSKDFVLLSSCRDSPFLRSITSSCLKTTGDLLVRQCFISIKMGQFKLLVVRVLYSSLRVLYIQNNHKDVEKKLRHFLDNNLGFLKLRATMSATSTPEETFLCHRSYSNHEA